jgi:hypothetical protein
VERHSSFLMCDKCTLKCQNDISYIFKKKISQYVYTYICYRKGPNSGKTYIKGDILRYAIPCARNSNILIVIQNYNCTERRKINNDKRINISN